MTPPIGARQAAFGIRFASSISAGLVRIHDSPETTLVAAVKVGIVFP